MTKRPSSTEFLVFRRASSFLVLLCLALGVATPARAEVSALLVGVSEYRTLGASKRLNGPPNDLALLSESLRRKGVQRITVLSDARAEGPLPTRAAILDALARIAAGAGPGDWVIVYFSGHGSQQPQRAAALRAGSYPEPDGLDEIFLPADAGHWTEQLFGVSNALRDDDIDRGLTRILERGASVWAIFDTCHAGNMAKSFDPRTASTDAVSRSVSPLELGVPAALLQRQRRARTKDAVDTGSAGAGSAGGAAAPAVPVGRLAMSHGSAGAVAKTLGAPPRGQLVAFYAAQPDEPTHEEMLPDRSGQPRRYGLFTWRLAGQLDRIDARGASFGELMDRVAGIYKAERRPFPNPMSEGARELRLPF